ncbi:MAG: hypothetical protein AAFR84_00865 [Pseudomonadota bacterium]
MAEAEKSFTRISEADGSWSRVVQYWDTECERYGENFDDYSPASLGTLAPLAQGAQIPRAGVYGLLDEQGNCLSVCQLNKAMLPGYKSWVLRLRHLVLAPKFDFDDALKTEEYVDVIAGSLIGMYAISESEMEAPHLKLHLRSPADRSLFGEIGNGLERYGIAKKVGIHGAWLHIDKQVRE